MIYTTTFSNGKTVAITAEDHGEYMERMVKEYDAEMSQGEARVVVTAGVQAYTNDFIVSPEGYALSKRLIQMEQE